MWNYIKGLFLSGSFGKKFHAAFVGIAGALLFLATLIGIGGGSWFFGFFIGSILFTKYEEKYKHTIEDISHVPYWGNKFGRRNTIELLEDETFHPYVLRSGRVCRNLKVSKSGRWFYVAGHYYPLYLVRGFDYARGELLMIDGTRLLNQNWLKNKGTREALVDLLKANRLYEVGMRKALLDSITTKAFNTVWKGSYKELAKADWDQIHYEWEKEVSEEAEDTLERSRANKLREALRLPDYALNSLHTRTLTDQEIDIICKAVQDKRIKSIEGWFNISDFKDDMCVGNGARLLSKLDPREDEESITFLFDCTRDIQKPYFTEAVNALMKYPRDVLVKEIEKRVAIAHETGDVLWGAGLIYLSGQIGYEISLSRESRGLGQGPVSSNFYDEQESYAQPYDTQSFSSQTFAQGAAQAQAQPFTQSAAQAQPQVKPFKP